MRPYWKGYLKLALVSCPIELHAACSRTERIRFRQINKKTGNQLRQQLIDEETGEPVDREHRGRGYEVAKGQYLIVEDEDLEAVEIESTHVIEIDSFVPRQQIDQRFFDTAYYVASNEPVAQEAFAVIREAMRQKKVVALGRLVLSKRERVIALEPYDKGLLGTTLRYPYEVRDAKDYLGGLPELAPAPDMLKLAAQILESKASDFDPKAFHDRYEEALLAHLKAKQDGAVQERKVIFPTPRRVINLMEALRRSVSDDKEQPPSRRGVPIAPARVPRRPARPRADQPLPGLTEPSLDRSARPTIHRSSTVGSRSHEPTR
jgi:DNA end-binding protein Ku